MKKMMLLLLSLLTIASAAQGTQGIQSALNGLESSTKAMLAAFSMISLGVGVSLLLIGAAIHFLKVKKMETPGNWKLASMVLMVLGALGVVGSVVGIILYVLTPVLIKSLMGSPV